MRTPLCVYIILAVILLPLAGKAATKRAGVGSGSDKGRMYLTLTPFWRYSSATPDEKAALSRLKSLLEKDLSLTVTVTGHTDTIGSPDQNLAIGHHYAREIVLELIRENVLPATRMRVETEGESSPVVAHGGFLDQAPNRRVVLSLATPQTKAVQPAAPVDTGSRRVLILEPSSGTVNRAFQKVRAIVESGSATALVTVNGISSLVAVQNSRIESEAVLNKGENSIEVMAWDGRGNSGRDQVTVTYLPPPPEVELFRPRDGDVFNTTTSPVIEVAGRIQSAIPLKEAYLFLNDSPRRIDIDRGGSFSQPVVLLRDRNEIKVEVLDIFGKSATSPNISVKTINMAPKDLVVYLTWDKAGVDLDLHVWGPDRRHTYYGALDPYESDEAIPGGGLDLDDQDGFGPEIFSLLEGLAGTYTIGARYHHSRTGEPCQAKITMVFHPADPARRITRVFGPVTMSPGAGSEWTATRFSLPEGVFVSR
ncbi:MAG: OmpA family protein [bacterium]|nr:MAG: OmpA family protein [bacterium]